LKNNSVKLFVTLVSKAS